MPAPETSIPSRRATDDDLFYLDLAREEFAASLGRIEETAKYLIGAIGAVAGLVLAGMQVKLAVSQGQAAPGTPLTWPFVLWGVSALFAIFVFFPLPYRHYSASPQSIRQKFIKARKVKWSLLLVSTLTFAAGLLVAAWQF
ncbi:MAG: hypothetical protein ONB48_13615 [candidate division KSB1 bacterium]|nr:hypothetical protein [candidate division KSB1 bacterium]MDZ7274861.1 hypothetical protein [candidate division KSB1 bacterium]MDZ7286687.1 hypothetical protein [candidate division KSB1 bacterium]MDZ7299150.1 hypothetical protein [candidate division KSB1 bacterium]MDZ7307040.1 hypothetical protein [candidate division KSB1 bacterium]